MKSLLFFLALILLGASGYYTYQHFIKNSGSKPVSPGVPGLSVPLDQTQKNVDQFNNKVQQGQNTANQLYGQ